MQGLPSLRIIFQSSDTSNIRKTILKFPESAASLLLQVLGIKFFVPYVLFSAVLSYQACCTTDALLVSAPKQIQTFQCTWTCRSVILCVSSVQRTR